MNTLDEQLDKILCGLESMQRDIKILRTSIHDRDLCDMNGRHLLKNVKNQYKNSGLCERIEECARNGYSGMIYSEKYAFFHRLPELGFAVDSGHEFYNIDWKNATRGEALRIRHIYEESLQLVP